MIGPFLASMALCTSGIVIIDFLALSKQASWSLRLTVGDPEMLSPTDNQYLKTFALICPNAMCSTILWMIYRALTRSSKSSGEVLLEVGDAKPAWGNLVSCQ
jgi:hypothetical protein